MTAVSITNNTGNVTFTFAEGEVDSVEPVVSADIDVIALPGAGPAAGLGFDFGGTTKQIRVRGKLFETPTSRTSSGTTTTILQQKQWLEAIINGNQFAKTFTSDYESETYNGSSFVATKVYAGRFSAPQKSGNPEWLDFEMELTVGT